MKYITLATGYLYRAHALLDGMEAARQVKAQFLHFTQKWLEGLGKKEEFLPPEVLAHKDDFLALEARTRQILLPAADLVIDVPYHILNETDGNDL